MPVEFVIGFQEDWLRFCFCELRRMIASCVFRFKDKRLANAIHLGFEKIDTHTRIKIATYYYNVIARLFESKPRGVIECEGFMCPEELREGYLALKKDITCGNQLLARMSRKIRRIDYSDGMFNDWGITHFHLGTSMQSDGVQYNGGLMVAYAYVADDNVYMLEIGAHGQWDNRRLLEKLMQEHGHAINRCKTYGDFNDIKQDNRDIRRQLRESNINLITNICGENFLPANLVVKDGTLAKAHCCLQNTLNELHNFENAVKEQINAIVAIAERSSAPLTPTIEINLFARVDMIDKVIYLAQIGAGLGIARYDGTVLDILPSS